MSEFETVAAVDDIPEGRGLAVPFDEQMIALFKCGENVYAIDDTCPHMGASLAEGELDGDCVVCCPWHGWRFRVTDGTWADNPPMKIESFEVRVVDGQVQVRRREDS